MAYANARDLIDLAAFVASHRHGVTYGAIQERFRVEHRQAQRLVDGLRKVFPDLVALHRDYDSLAG